jgi:hypothetical protein
MFAKLLYFANDFSLYIFLVAATFLILIFFGYKVFKSPIGPAAKKLLIALMGGLFSFILVFSLFEAYIRYIYDEPDGLGFLKVNSKWHQRHVVTNTYFVRDRDFKTEKEEGTARIGVIGDSISFGGGIERVEDRFSNLLEKKLNENGQKVEVFNLGKLGYDTQGQIEDYEKFKHLNFDIIVWQYFLNDIQPQNQSTGTPIISANSNKAKILEFLSDKSFFFDYVFWRFSARYANTFEQLKNADLAQYRNPDVFENHKSQITEFIKQLKNEDKKVVVLIFPFVHLLGESYPAEVHKQIKGVFSANGVETIDLLDFLKSEDPLTLVAGRFDPHPNEKVHELAAQKLFEALNSYLEKRQITSSPYLLPR